MRKLLLLLTLLAFVATAPLAMAQATKEKPKKEEKKITCCIKGKCEEGMTKAECKKEKGKVVKDCSKCKPAKEPVKK
jgi:hypothetical protein